jgi:hypothetical protein
LPIAKHTKAIAEIFDVSLFRFIDQHIPRIDHSGVGSRG